jgi:hypothetical protein
VVCCIAVVIQLFIKKIHHDKNKTVGYNIEPSMVIDAKGHGCIVVDSNEEHADADDVDDPKQ